MDQMNITVTLSVTQWNIVMKALGELPFKESAEIINSVRTQAEKQLAPPVTGSAVSENTEESAETI